ncbi:NYN domain-containing protein [Fusarium sp. Ph1]|nr:NYN domain-containing protein [Fusarium sp. Ph1]
MTVKRQQPSRSLSVPAARNQLSPPNSDTSEQKRKIYIYIDHSNVWIEPYNRSGYQWRYDIASFRSLLIRFAAKTGNMNHRNVQAEVNIYGYVPDCLKPIWRSQGARIHELRKSFAADLHKGIEREHGEKEVDTSLVSHSVRKAVEA